MRHSEKTDQLDAAILEVQRAVPTVKKTADGAEYQGKRTKYAPHEQVWELAREELWKHALNVTQGGREGGGGTQWLVTRVVHITSGQWSEHDIRVESAQAGMQKLGAAWSYARRIGLLSALGIVPEGDDTDAAHEMQGRAAKPPRVERAARPAGSPEDAERVAEEVLRDLPVLPTRVGIEEAAARINEVRAALTKPTNERLRAAFKAARERVDQREPGSDG